MALAGDLTDLDLPALLQLLATHGKTGTLVLRDESGNETTLLVDAGDLVGASATHRQRNERLGELLVKAELLTADGLADALREQQASGRRLGELLVETRRLRRQDLSEMLRVQVYETVFRAFTWKRGKFTFEPGQVDYDRGLIQPVRADHLLMDGFRMVDEWPLIKRWIPSFDLVLERTEAGERVRLPGAGAGGGRRAPELAESQWTMLALAVDRPSVQRAIHRSRLGEFEACKALMELQEKGLVRLKRTTDGPTSTELPAVRASGGSGPLRWVADLAVAAAALGILAAALLGRPDSAARGELGRVLGRTRLVLVESAVEAWRIDRGTRPATLAELVQAGLVREADVRLVERSYRYEGPASGRFASLDAVVSVAVPAPPSAMPDRPRPSGSR